MIVGLGLLYLQSAFLLRQVLQAATQLYMIIWQALYAVRHSLFPLHTLDIEEPLNPNIACIITFHYTSRIIVRPTCYALFSIRLYFMWFSWITNLLLPKLVYLLSKPFSTRYGVLLLWLSVTAVCWLIYWHDGKSLSPIFVTQKGSRLAKFISL